MPNDTALIACVMGLCLACGRQSNRTESHAEPSAVHSSALRTSTEQAPKLREPTRLIKLPVSAYSTSLAIDGEAVYLMTSNAAYRLVAGQPAHGIELDLGTGPALTQSAFIFWSKGAIWRAPKEGGQTRLLAKFPHQPQYFVTSGDAFAWVDNSDEGVFTIQSLNGSTPRVLVRSALEISSLDMIGNSVYFVQRSSDAAWRIGRVRVTGGEPEYATEHRGPTPAMLTGADEIYYFDMSKTEIRRLTHGLQDEETLLKNFVCSPIFVADEIYCGCVEGLFDVHKELKKPRVLVFGPHGPITYIRANANLVAWIVDAGPDMLAVDMLAAHGGDTDAAVQPR